MSWQRQFRYILSMRGNDTGSNFIPALDSNSVVLREEDGWELFYSAAIRAWEHYIPLAPLLSDLDEKAGLGAGQPRRMQGDCRTGAGAMRVFWAMRGYAICICVLSMTITARFTPSAKSLESRRRSDPDCAK